MGLLGLYDKKTGCPGKLLFLLPLPVEANEMRFICRLSVTMLLGAGVLFTGLVNAQSLLPSGTSEQTAQTETKTESPKDALGRDTPRGTVLGYIAAMAKEDYEGAAQYLDLSFVPESKRKARGKALAKNLRRLLDQAGSMLPDPLISDTPDGLGDDNLDENLDRVGEITLNDHKIPVLVENISRKKMPPRYGFFHPGR